MGSRSNSMRRLFRHKWLALQVGQRPQWVLRPVLRRLFRPPLLQAPELMALRLDRWLVRRREARRQGFSRQEVRQVLDLRMLRVLHLAARHQDRSQALHPQPDSPPSSRPSRRRSPTSTRSSGTKSPSR